MTSLNGEDAVDVITVQRPFDVIFMDLQMPILNGYQTVKILRNKCERGEVDLSHTKIIALSAITKN